MTLGHSKRISVFIQCKSLTRQRKELWGTHERIQEIFLWVEVAKDKLCSPWLVLQ